MAGPTQSRELTKQAVNLRVHDIEGNGRQRKERAEDFVRPDHCTGRFTTKLLEHSKWEQMALSTIKASRPNTALQQSSLLVDGARKLAQLVN